VGAWTSARCGRGGYFGNGRLDLVDPDEADARPDMSERSAIDALLERARVGLDRVEAADLDREVAHGAVVVDTRPLEQRSRDGELPGAIVVDRNVLEWRLDPTSATRLPQAVGAEVRFIIVCDEGYSSSLAAASLRELGLLRATDLVGGFQAWLTIQAPTSD
jgi:rhodanese-related sulfurtransferase